jgi:hypothetical protein
LEQLGNYIERAQIISLDMAEKKLYLNSFKFFDVIFNHLSSRKIPNLTTLSNKKKVNSMMNMANVHFDSFALGFEDACY